MLPRALVDAQVSMSSEALALPDGRRLNDWLTATPDEALIEQSGIHIMVRGTDEVLVHLDETQTRSLAASLADAPFRVVGVDSKPYTRKPYAPFRTTTL